GSPAAPPGGAPPTTGAPARASTAASTRPARRKARPTAGVLVLEPRPWRGKRVALVRRTASAARRLRAPRDRLRPAFGERSPRVPGRASPATRSPRLSATAAASALGRPPKPCPGPALLLRRRGPGRP